MSGRAQTSIERAWQRLGAAISGASAALDRADTPSSPVEIAEAYNYWAQTITFGLRRELHFANRDQPFFHRCGLDTKLGFDNPDNVYEVAKIRPDATYRVTGTRGDAHFVEFSVSVGFPGVVAQPRTIAKYDTTELDVGSDGSIELFVGGEPRERNWFPLEPDATSFLVRQVFYEWSPEAEPGVFRIERVGGEGESLAPLDPDVMAERIDRVAEFVEAGVSYWIDYMLDLRKRVPVNQFEPPGLQGRDMPQLNAARAFFCWGLFELDPDEALIVEVDAIQQGYMGFHLVNFWLQSLDFVNRVTSLNRHQARVDADGKIRYVVSERDPGTPNWLDTEGHREGGLLFRFALTSETPQPAARLVKLADLPDALPADTPRITSEMRREQIARRQAHIARRFQW